MVMFTRGAMKKVCLMELVNTNGQTGQSILEVSIRDLSKEKVDGKKIAMMLSLIVMKAIITKIRKMEWESLNGPLEIFILEIIEMMREKDLEKCNGQTDLFTLENGSEEYNMEKARCHFQTVHT